MNVPAGIDPALFATMSPEEQEAFADSTPEEIASLSSAGPEKDPVHTAGNVDTPKAEADGDEGDDADDADTDGDGEVEGAEAAAAGTDAAAAAAPEQPAAQEQPQAEAAPAQAAPFMYRFDLPADYEQRVNDAKTALTEAGEQFDSGDLTREEYQRRVGEIHAQQSDLNAMRIQHDIARQSQEQAAEAARMAVVHRLFAAAKAEDGGGIDYLADAGKRRDLDVFLKALASAAPEDDDKPLSWYLDEAHKRVLTLHGITAGKRADPVPAPTVKKTPAEIKAAAAAARKVDMSSATPDLSQVPGGDGPGDVGGEFEDVLSLEGDAFEAAITRMAKTQPERWARFQQSGAQ